MALVKIPEFRFHLAVFPSSYFITTQISFHTEHKFTKTHPIYISVPTHNCNSHGCTVNSRSDYAEPKPICTKLSGKHFLQFSLDSPSYLSVITCHLSTLYEFPCYRNATTSKTSMLSTHLLFSSQVSPDLCPAPCLHEPLQPYQKCLQSQSTLFPAVRPSSCHRTPEHCFILL
jgi:hypothetical protein